MKVGFRYSGIWKEFGDSNLLQSFFSTINYLLEKESWGSKYPYLLKKFYDDKIEPEDVTSVLEELKDIRTKFQNLNKEDIIWNINDIYTKPKVDVCSKVKANNLSECFLSEGGKNIFDLLTEIFEFCKKRGIAVKIQKEGDLYK